MTEQTALDARVRQLSAALLVEQAVRSRLQAAALHQELVDGSSRVHGQQLAFLCLRRGGRFRLAAASAVAQVDRSGPFGQWIARLAGRLQASGAPGSVRLLKGRDLNLPPEDWAVALPREWLWLPLLSPTGKLLGVLALLRSMPWHEADRLLAEPLAHCYGHALWARRNRLPDFSSTRPLQAALLLLALVGLSFIPVRLDMLAPAEVVAADPVPVTAPFDGVVAEVPVRPYQMVRAGDLLLAFDARELAMRRDVASKTLAVAEAELGTLRNQAFLDPGSKNQVLIAEQKVALERENYTYADERFQRHRLTATEDGVVLFDDRLSWKGRPVATGQALMTLAKPEHLELRIDVPVGGLIPSGEGKEVRLFLDMDPSQPVQAHLSRLGYEARPEPGGGLAYRFVATFDADTRHLQLGARGTARVYGNTVTLGYYLLRRPISAVRQFLGL